jgi:hypothetical protein
LPSTGECSSFTQGAYLFVTIGDGLPIKIQIPLQTSVDLATLILANTDPPSIVTDITSGNSNCTVINPGAGVAGTSTITCSGGGGPSQSVFAFSTGYQLAPATATTVYFSVYGHPDAAVGNMGARWASAAVLSNLTCTLTVDPGTGATERFTLYDTGTPEPMTCTITGSGSGTATQCQDTTDTFSMNAGDPISIQDQTTGTPAPNASASCQVAVGIGSGGGGGGGGGSGTVNAGSNPAFAQYQGSGSTVVGPDHER